MSFRFLNFQVYKDSKNLHQKIVYLTKKFPKDFDYLKDQIRRSSLSIALNIAEGSAKLSDKDFHRFLAISLGSANETAAALDIAHTEHIISEKEYLEAIKLCENVVNQLGGFVKKLRVSS